MRVIVSRSGGFAGIRVTWEVRVDELPDAADWYLLIETLPWGEVRIGPIEPDRYIYRILAEPHEATLAERQLRGPWRELVDRVREVGETKAPAASPAEPRPGADRSPSATRRPGSGHRPDR